MTHVLVVAGALLTEADWRELPPQWAPARLARRLTRARHQVHTLDAAWADGAAHMSWLATAYRVPGDAPACAPFAWRALGGADPSPETGVWFCEPVHLNLQAERTVLQPIVAPPLDEQEEASLFEEAADSAREAGAQLQRTGGRWFLLTSPNWQLTTTALPAALGASIEARLPQGPDAMRWRRLMNEVQMRWHAHRINREREARGEQTVNGLWLHGGGQWQALAPSRFAGVAGDDPIVAGWQQAAADRPSGAGSTGSDALTVWTELFEPYWRRDWRTWSQRWTKLEALVEDLLANGPLEWVACGRRVAAHARIGRAQALMPWPSRTLHQCLLETPPR